MTCCFFVIVMLDAVTTEPAYVVTYVVMGVLNATPFPFFLGCAGTVCPCT